MRRRRNKVPDVMTGNSTIFAVMPKPFSLAPGHKLRHSPCFVCKLAIGGQPMTFVSFINTEPCDCGLYDMVSMTFPCHETCAQVDDSDLCRALDVLHPGMR